MDTDSYLPKAVDQRRMGRVALERLLTNLETGTVPAQTTIYSKAGGFGACLDTLPRVESLGLAGLRELAPTVEKRGTGSVLFRGESSSLVVLPPFPVASDQVLVGWDASSLRSLLSSRYMVGVVLLRLGRLAVGVLQGETLVSSKTGFRWVKGRHSAGGQSQGRFQRGREKQVREMYQKTCSVVKAQFAPYEERLDYVILGGERFTLGGFLKECEYLQKLSPRILKRVLNVREPKLDTLKRVIDTIWESEVLRVGYSGAPRPSNNAPAR